MDCPKCGKTTKTKSSSINKNGIKTKYHTCNHCGHKCKSINSEMFEANGRLRGVKHPDAKMTEEKVREARKLYKEGKSSYYLADIYDIDQKTAYAIVSGRTWKHVA